MAEVANSLTGPQSGSQPSADSAPLVPDSPEDLVLSPSVKAAMDRILPCSASQLLQHRLPLEDTPLGEKSQNRIMPRHHHHHHQQQFASGSGSSRAPDHTKTNSGSSSKSNSDNSKSASDNSNPKSWKSRGVGGADEASIPGQKQHNGGLSSVGADVIRENGDMGNNTDQPGHPCSGQEQPKKGGVKLKISKADLEIMTSGVAEVTSGHNRLARRSSLERSSSDSLLKVGSEDSDDVSRPFAAVKEKKKERRKKKKKRDKPSEAPDNSVTSVGDSEDDFRLPKQKEQRGNLCESNSQSSLELSLSESTDTLLLHSADRQDMHVAESESDLSVASLSNQGSKSSAEMHSGQNCFASDDVSNNSFSSAKENMDNCAIRKLKHQKLPRVRSSCFDVEKHKNRIRKTFPPCYIVVEQMTALLSQTDPKIFNLATVNKDGPEAPGNPLPLSVRLKKLSNMCAKGQVMCRKNKKAKTVEFKYTNIFEETIIPDSEDDFEVTRGSGRSLRKRDKTISYVEPTEADIFYEFKRKRGRSKTEEADDVASDSEASKKKKPNPAEEEDSVILVDSPASKNDETPLTEYARARPAQVGRLQEVVCYPKTPLSKDALSKSVKSKHPEARAIPPTASTVQTLLGPQPMPGLISSFPPYLPGMPVSTTAPGGILPSISGTTTLPGVRPQFCMVKMDGKDVLLQVLPPSSPGAASQGSTLLLPGGKRLVVPPNHQLSQQISRAPRLVSPLPLGSMPLPLFSPPVAGGTTASLAVPSMTSSLATSVRVNLSVGSSLSGNVTPITVYPTFPAATATSTSPAVGPLLSSRATATSATVGPLLSSRVAAAAASATLGTLFPSTAAATTTASTCVAMAAPNSTSVVRNIRVPTAADVRGVVPPNQATGMRAVRIFVPGCQATGVPGRFATLGSVAASPSGLTRLTASSNLLPQRKEAKDSLTPEERAEKRRKLEKKYPLPPGVVIKTEPLESPSSSQSSSALARSLLPSNIQLISAARRPGAAGGGVGGVQSIRLMNPAALSSGGSLPVIVRGSTSGGGRQTFLIPTSLGMLTTNATGIRSSLAAAVAASSSQSASAVVSGVGTISVLPAFSSTLTTSTTTTTVTTTPNPAASCQSRLTSSDSPSRSPAPGASSPPATLPGSAEHSSGSVIAKLKTELATMTKLASAQERMGLRGERLEKLKLLVKQKEDTLKQLLGGRSDEGATTAAAVVSTGLAGHTDSGASGVSRPAADSVVIEID